MGLQNSPRELGVTTWLRNWLLTLGAEQILVISPEIRRHLKRRRRARDAAGRLQLRRARHGRVRRLSPTIAWPCGASSASPSRADRLDHRRAAPAQEPRAVHRRRGTQSRPSRAARFLIIGEGELLRRAASATPARETVARSPRSSPACATTSPDCSPATDVYVKPGVLEGFIGITVLEALALGKPVVAFDTEDVKLALTDGQTGLIVPNGDVPALAERIVYLLRNPEVGAQLGQAGQQLVHGTLRLRRAGQSARGLLSAGRRPTLRRRRRVESQVGQRPVVPEERVGDRRQHAPRARCPLPSRT